VKIQPCRSCPCASNLVENTPADILIVLFVRWSAISASESGMESGGCGAVGRAVEKITEAQLRAKQ
jgi:hypothetical protein